MQATAKKLVTTPESIKMAMAAKMDSAGYTSWIAPAKIDVCSDVLSVIAPNQFSADFIKSVYLSVLDSVAADFNLSLHVGTAASSQTVATTANDNVSKVFIPAPIVTTVPVAFDGFISSEENAFVVSACKKLAAGAVSFSPLFIYGTTGCGKTLLAKCISNASNARVLMMSGGQFVSEFGRSMREGSVFAFKDFCRNCDTFILDDVQVLAGKKATTEEFVQLVLDLRAANKNVVLTANAAPASLGGFDRRVQSLFASGLVADVATPTKNVKKTMLIRSGVALDVAEMLSGRVAGDCHLISGVAMKIKTYTELMGEKVTTSVAERLLSDTLQKNKTPLSMVKSMCSRLGVSFDEICGKGRARTIVRARQIMMTALKTATNLSLAEIGRLVGDRDHATVLYAIAQTEKLKATDLMVAAEIEQMIEECR
ncbi:MAG: AAA family ATPase [Rickettsiales bacterium]|jgi:chromosomal replication initiator protein|nr:AAA family ATPase [Rickettsiales bacterium]